jgi:hypothetical protein
MLVAVYLEAIGDGTIDFRSTKVKYNINQHITAREIPYYSPSKGHN